MYRWRSHAGGSQTRYFRVAGSLTQPSIFTSTSSQQQEQDITSHFENLHLSILCILIYLLWCVIKTPASQLLKASLLGAEFATSPLQSSVLHGVLFIHHQCYLTPFPMQMEMHPCLCIQLNSDKLRKKRRKKSNHNTTLCKI